MNDINILGILIAAIITSILGILWYSPFLFGTHGKKLSQVELDMLDVGKERTTAQRYTIHFLAQIVMSYVVAEIIVLSHITSATGALWFGCILWLGFVATTTLGSVTWKHRSTKLLIIDNTYYFISLILIALIVVWM